MKIAPQIVLLREGADTSQGKEQIIANINACLEIVSIIKTTLGPRGRDKLIIDKKGKATVSNDGATIMSKMEIAHPCVKLLVDLSRTQDAEAGDGTTSVVVLTGEILKELSILIREGYAPTMLISGIKEAIPFVLKKIKEMEYNFEGNREILKKCALTAINSKLIASEKNFFAQMVVDSVLLLDSSLDLKMLGIKKVSGGVLQNAILVEGVAFKKAFSYAGFEQQPKKIENPKIACLNVELELKAEYDNAEVRVESVNEYQNIIDAEWEIIFTKLRKIVESGANVVFSKLPIGDLAMQYFADRNIFCAGRIPSDDMERVLKATGGTFLSTVNEIKQEDLGEAGLFEEKEVGNERFSFLTKCPKTKTCTIVLRGGSSQFIDEVERSLHDSIMVVRRAIKTKTVVPGGGAVEMEISQELNKQSLEIKGKSQFIFKALARSFESIPRQIAENSALDPVLTMVNLRNKHLKGGCSYGINIESEEPIDTQEQAILEPSLIKKSISLAAMEATCSIISIDYTICTESKRQPEMGALPGMQ